MLVEDGTGHFQGATGQLDFDPAKGDLAECVDPLCLDGTTWPTALAGWISIPRP